MVMEAIWVSWKRANGFGVRLLKGVCRGATIRKIPTSKHDMKL